MLWAWVVVVCPEGARQWNRGPNQHPHKGVRPCKSLPLEPTWLPTCGSWAFITLALFIFRNLHNRKQVKTNIKNTSNNHVSSHKAGGAPNSMEKSDTSWKQPSEFGRISAWVKSQEDQEPRTTLRSSKRTRPSRLRKQL
jgi:hypothetical protein